MSPMGGALVALGLVLSLLAGLMAFAAVAGRMCRALDRPQMLRCLSGALTAAFISILLLGFGLYGLFGPLFDLLDSAVSGTDAYAQLLLGLQSAVVGNALWPALLIPAVGALSGIAAGARPGRGSSLISGGQMLGELFSFWLPAKKLANGSGYDGNEEPGFEITMASGEEVDEEERTYIENILELDETTAQEVMRPRTDVVALDAAWEPSRILEIVAGATHSRFPVYEETIDEVIGVLHMRDLLEHIARSGTVEGLDVRSILLEPIFIPASRKIGDVLRDLQRNRAHMAVVLDEYGGTAGILTIEDLLEEIVGEIQDEYDQESRMVWRREDGSYVVTAQMPLEDLSDLLQQRLEEEDVETLGGFISAHLGRIPKARESVETEGLRFTVLSVERNRIGHVRIEQLSDSAMPDDGQD
jgi:Mg2+/Co2+ transporter CorC